MEYLLNNLRNWRTLLSADFVPFVRNDFYMGLSPWHHDRYDRNIYQVYDDILAEDPHYDDGWEDLEDQDDYYYDPNCIYEYETADQAMFSDSLNYR